MSFKTEGTRLECPDCEESLESANGSFTNEKNESRPGFACYTCDQMFMLDKKKLFYTSYKADGSALILNCIMCNKKEYFRQKMVYICEDGAFYNSYCENCALLYLRDWHDLKDRGAITKENLREMADFYSTVQTNKLLQDPERYAKLMQSPRYLEAMEKMGISKEFIDSRMTEINAEKKQEDVRGKKKSK